jgi:hypothetical protein
MAASPRITAPNIQAALPTQRLQTNKPEPVGSGLLAVEFESDKFGGERGIRLNGQAQRYAAYINL